ncbi:MAG: hypothetical protein GH151_06260 [Bacteroidetes bacterium]|nr:hypothetical protein [Bacteroidota bacterium]
MGEEKILNHKISEEPGKKRPVGLIIITFVLALCLGALIFLYFNQKSEMIEMEKILTEEKDSLANELSNLMFQYDTLKTNNESLNAKLETEQNKIRSLLTIQASNAQKIRLYKKELATLRRVMKSYIVQIDSLNTKNIQLTTENIEVRKKLQEVQEINVELSQIEKDLSSKVEIASVILAKNILPTPLNARGREKYKIERIDKIRVCFTLRENPIVEAGKKDVYMRIARPDELILVDSPDNLFEFEDEQIVYSSIRTVDYLNQDVDMCIYWNNNGDLIHGNYTVYLYLEGNHIGSTTFLLK